MANYSRWDDTKNKRRAPDDETRTGDDQDLALGQLIYDLRTEAGLSQRQLAERMGTTQSVISRLRKAAAPATGSTPSPASLPPWTDTW
jgi:ribosome-binding protein aMBF1 (putative translation factor)